MKKINFDFKSVNWKKIIISALIGAVISFLIYYVFLPPINPHSVSFWIYLTAVIISFTVPYLGISLGDGPFVFVANGNGKYERRSIGGIKFNNIKLNKIALGVIAAPIAVIIIGSIFSSTFFFARSYADVIDIDESAVFEDDMPETTDDFKHIALMDTQSALMLGNRELGFLSNNVSQYTLSDYYTQINYKGLPKKVTNLEYDGFFKWLLNNDTGIPGAVVVDPVNPDADYHEFENAMIYAESAYFHQDLERKLRFDYPTKIFHSISFEIDEDGNPFFIVSCATAKVSLFGAMDISEVIAFNPTDGTSEIYSIDSVPKWIDVVYTGELACEKYNWYGTLSGGFINSIIGNKGCKQTTDAFGYIALYDDVWYFTGVTSVTGDDMSNIGFILSNARTGEYKFYPVIGAEEHSAMNAAEGEVQEKGYEASFPSLVNVSGEATYIMVLKDATGIVKLYAQWEVYVDPYREHICLGNDLSFFSEGDAHWVVDESQGSNSQSSVRSGDITDNESTTLKCRVTGKGKLTFDVKTSCESNYDLFNFYVDDSLQCVASGHQDWTQQSFDITEDGVHELRWTYYKDGSVAEGSDCCWIDNIRWEPMEG